MSFKKVISVLLGKATPFQIILSCLLASMLAFIPGFSSAPFLFILLIFFILIFSVNIGIVFIIWVVAKALSYLFVSVSFSVGICLLHSFLQPVFKWLINAPLFAFAGFNFYLVTGGQLVGIVIGLIIGLTLTYGVKTLRAKAALLQSDKPSYNKWANKLWVKILSWIALGQSLHKVDWALLSKARVKHPFRITGLIIVSVLIIIAFVAQSTLQSHMVKNILVQQLEKVNGATVNLAGSDLDLSEGKISLHGLQLANPDDLTKNIFSAEVLTADISIRDILRARLVLDNLNVNNAKTGGIRQSPAKLYVATTSTTSMPLPEKEVEETSETKSLPKFDKYIKNAHKWQVKLQQGQRLLDFFSGSDDSATPTEIGETNKENNPKNQAKLYGYDEISADFLIEKTPTLTIKRLTVHALDVESLPKDPLNISATNISTEPFLLKKTPTINVKSKSGNFRLSLEANHIAHPDMQNSLIFYMNNIATEEIMKSINTGSLAMTGGYFTIETNGSWKNGNQITINLPLKVTLNDSNISINKSTETHIDNLPLSIIVSGSLNNPSVKFNSSDILQNLIQSGLKQQLKEKIGSTLKDKLKGLNLF